MAFYPTTQITDPGSSKQAQVSLLRGLKVCDPVRLVGKSFSGTTKDTNFWTEAVVGSGSVVQNGKVTLATGTTANSTVQYQSNRHARYLASAPNEARIIATMVTAGTGDNVRRWGMFGTSGTTPDDGAYFQLNGAVFSVVHVVGGTPVTVNSGSFNGAYGVTFDPSTTQHRYTIQCSQTTILFSVDDQLLHSMSLSGTKLGVSWEWPITLHNINSGGQTVDVSMDVFGASIVRLGPLDTQPTYRNITAAGTYNLKYGSGALHRVIVGSQGSANSNVKFYDDTTGVATLICTLDTSKIAVPTSIDFNVYFQTGLKLVVTNTVEITVTWE